MDTGTVLLINLGLVLAGMSLLWLLSLPLRNASIIDIAWGPGFAVIALNTLWLVDGDPARQWLLTALTAVWGLRLGVHLAVRNVGHGEDRRYTRMRRDCEAAGGRFWLRSLFTVFWLQAAIMWFVALPVQVGQTAGGPAGPGALAAAGAALWLIGFAFEAIGDWQLQRFRAQPTNAVQVLDRGLWRYTRHPNYFGNACLWWGLWLIAADGGAAWWTFVGPALMTFLLLRVSGVTLLERELGRSKPQYRDYVRRTPAFVPWLPRK